MACFLVPTAEAVVTTILMRAARHREWAQEGAQDSRPHFSDKLSVLNKMLWGGSGLLAFEHLWHGEIQPFFPFLTAAADPDSASVMLQEMALNGTSMAMLITLVWAGGVAVTEVMRRRGAEPEETV